MKTIFLICIFMFVLSCTLKKNSSNNSLPQGPLNLLMDKSFKKAMLTLAFDGKRVAIRLNDGDANEFDVDTGAIKNYSISSWCKSEDKFIAGLLSDGIMVACGNSLYAVLENQPPKKIHEFKDRIRWADSSGNDVLALTSNDEYGYFSDGKLILQGKQERGELRSGDGYLELYQKNSKLSSAIYFQNGKVEGKCEISSQEDIYGMGIISGTHYAYGYKLERGGEDFILVGIDCSKKSIIWKKSFREDIFKLPARNNNSVGEISVSRVCGQKICLNISTNDLSFPGSAQTGVYCVSAENGDHFWSSFNTFKTDPPINNNLNIVGPMVCDNQKIVAFKNSAPFILSEDVTAKTEKFQNYVADGTIKQLAEYSRPSEMAYLTTSTVFLPKVSKGRIAIWVGEHLIVLGK